MKAFTFGLTDWIRSRNRLQQLDRRKLSSLDQGRQLASRLEDDFRGSSVNDSVRRRHAIIDFKVTQRL
jgi:hypothetical protein